MASRCDHQWVNYREILGPEIVAGGRMRYRIEVICANCQETKVVEKQPPEPVVGKMF